MLAAPRVRRVKVVHRGPLRGELAIDLAYGSPVQAEGGRCRLALQLDAGLPALRIQVTGDNRAGDHRLRLRVATDLAGASTLADAAFHPVERSPVTISAAEARMEQVVPTAPLHRWVARFAGERGATLYSDGLAEYESVGDGAVVVTLLRAVGELSRGDLPERPGHAGWPSATPDAQSVGPFAASFALALHGADSPAMRDRIEQLADDVLLPITGETLRSNLADPLSAGGFELSGDGLAFSSAAPAQRDGWIVLRCVNRRRVAGHGRWRLGRDIAEAQLARMDETPSGPLVVDGDSVDFPAGPGEIVTVLLR
jgi:alpha-mannosidase